MISLDCSYCELVFLSATPAVGQKSEVFLAAWKADATANSDVYHCVDCGARFNIEDDGLDVGSGGSVRLDDISAPRIDSLTIGSGARTGGEALYITGSALDLGGLVVKFGGKWAPAITNVTSTQVRVVTPQGIYRLKVAEELTMFNLSARSGSISVNEDVRVNGEIIGRVHVVVGALCGLVAYENISPLSNLVGGVMIGQNSGAFGTIDTAGQTQLIEGEEVVGQASGAKGVLKALDGYVVDNPTSAFVTEELVKGSASNGYVRLQATPYSGAVDVEVSNGNGQRLVGGTLKNGFTYL